MDRDPKKGQQRPIMVAVLTVVLVALLILSVYLATEISSLQGQVSSLQLQNSQIQFQFQNLQNQEGNIQSALNSLVTTGSASVMSIVVSPVCISVTANCITANGTDYVYLIALNNNGTISIPNDSSVYLGFKDGTRGTDFSFNTTLSTPLPAGGQADLVATSWPSSVNVTSELSSGDEIGLEVMVGSFSIALQAHVQVCSVMTTTFLNYTITQTATNTRCE